MIIMKDPEHMDNIIELAYLQRWETTINKIGEVVVKTGKYRGMRLSEVYARDGVVGISCWAANRDYPIGIIDSQKKSYRDKWFGNRYRVGLKELYHGLYKIYSVIQSSSDPIKWSRRRIVQRYGPKVLDPQSRITIYTPTKELIITLELSKKPRR